MKLEAHAQPSHLRTTKYVSLLEDVQSKYEVEAGEEITIKTERGEVTRPVQIVDKESVYPSGGWSGEKLWLHPQLLNELGVEKCDKVLLNRT